MPTLRDLPQQIPAPWEKLGCKSPRVEANPRGALTQIHRVRGERGRDGYGKK